MNFTFSVMFLLAQGFLKTWQNTGKNIQKYKFKILVKEIILYRILYLIKNIRSDNVFLVIFIILKSNYGITIYIIFDNIICSYAYDKISELSQID